MDSKRRKMEVHIWDQPFFSDLNEREKLFWWFLNCKCNNIGVYQHNRALAEFHCSGKIDLNAFIETVNKHHPRVELLQEDVLWVRDFVRETWGTITAETNLGKSCWRLLIKHSLAEKFISTFPDCIKIESFREAIKDGELPAIQPQGSNSPVTGNTDSEELQPQGSNKAVTYNYNYPYNESNNENRNTPMNQGGGDSEGGIKGSIAKNHKLEGEGGTSEPPETTDWERVVTAVEECLKIFPSTSGDIQFMEEEQAQKILRGSVLNGVPLDEAAAELKSYLKSQKSKVMQTGEEYDLFEILKDYENVKTH